MVELNLVHGTEMKKIGKTKNKTEYLRRNSAYSNKISVLLLLYESICISHARVSNLPCPISKSVRVNRVCLLLCMIDLLMIDDVSVDGAVCG